MYVVKCSVCKEYITEKGENYYQLYEYIKGTRDRQNCLTMCHKCRKKLLSLEG